MSVVNLRYVPGTGVVKYYLPAGTHTLTWSGTTGKIVYLADDVLDDIDDGDGTTLNTSNPSDEVTVSAYITVVSDTATDVLTVGMTETGTGFGSLQDDVDALDIQADALDANILDIKTDLATLVNSTAEDAAGAVVDLNTLIDVLQALSAKL